MNASRLLEHFDRISEAPDAVPKLRQFVLDLAVRGKLTIREDGDDSVDELLARTSKAAGPASTMERRVVGHREAPFSLPLHWRWVPLSLLAEVLMGNSPPGDTYNKEGDGIPLINGPVEFTSGPFGRTTINQYTTKPTVTCEAGDLLMCVRGSTTGRTNIAGFRACIGRGVAALRPRFDSNYFRIFIWWSRASIIAMGRGIAFPSVSRQQIQDLQVPLPSLAEQRRIVAKVDELMGLCDRLEAARAIRDTRRVKAGAGCFARIERPVPENQPNVNKNAGLLLSNLASLVADAESLNRLRQSILTLAVRGQLVRQNPAESASPSFGISDDLHASNRVDMTLPPGWAWARVEDVASARLGKMLDRAKNSGKAYRYLGNTNVHWFEIRTDALKEIKIADSDGDKYLLQAGDVLVCEGGHGIGRAAVWRAELLEIAFQKALHRVRPGKDLNGDFFAYCIKVYFDSGVLQSYFTGVGIPHFTGQALAKLVFPLPPIKEQRRIVARVNELMELCDRLEEQLETQHDVSGRLLDTVLADSLRAAAR